jgi:hypothetical protein
MIKTLRSRIHEYFKPEVISELLKVCNNNKIPDNNAKVPIMLEILKKHDVEFDELGPGTNRLAILIDNYVFKLAMDKWGKQDNVNEFTVSMELQPYVVKTYEVDEHHLISVCEYVTIISREEFIEKREEIRDILAEISESYLLGDVGTVPKNFCNWGYRDDGQLTILDYAYIYRIKGDELLCSNDQEFLEYDENFHSLVCPRCRTKYSFTDIRRRISMEEERHENNLAKDLAYPLTLPMEKIRERYDEDGHKQSSSLYKNHTDNSKEDTAMRKDYEDQQSFSEESEEDVYQRELENLMSKRNKSHHTQQPVDRTIVEVERQNQEGTSHVRISHESSGSQPDELTEAVNTIESYVQKAEDHSDRDNQSGDHDANYSHKETYVADDGSTVTERESVVRDGNYYEASREVIVEEEGGTIIENNKIQSTGDLVRSYYSEETISTTSDHYEVHDDSDEHTEESHDNEAVVHVDQQTNDSNLKIIPPQGQEEKLIVSETTLKLSDQITMKNTVSIESSDDKNLKELRRQLMADGDAEFSDEYEHMYENEKLRKNKGGRNEWV